MSWPEYVIAVLGGIAWGRAAANHWHALVLLRELRKLREETAAAKELAETLNREESARDWQHMSTRGGLN